MSALMLGFYLGGVFITMLSIQYASLAAGARWGWSVRSFLTVLAVSMFWPVIFVGSIAIGSEAFGSAAQAFCEGVAEGSIKPRDDK